jgi:hypothetical protein
MNRQRSKGCSVVKSTEHSFEPLVPLEAFMVNDEAPVDSADARALDAHRDARQLVRLVQCPRCSYPLSTPVTLPCSHTVCRGCLPAPQPRTNISYPNTPDRLTGIACPLLGCGAEHASAECSVDVTLTKLVEAMKAEVAQHRPASGATPTLLVEILSVDNDGTREPEKHEQKDKGHREVLQGGRLAATFAMAEMGKLRYSSEVDYQTMSANSENYDALDSGLCATT